MNVRDAILKTADLFEREPGMFDYFSCFVPDCGMPGCAIGWIAAFRGVPAGTVLASPEYTEKDGLGNHRVFYQRMSALDRGNWTCRASDCARTLRAYADRWHPAEPKHTGLPTSVLRIFEPETTEA